jgi:small subunit ribosomal protein S3
VNGLGKLKAIGSDFFVEDIKIRKFIEKAFPRTWISKIVIRKTGKEWEIIIFTSKVGVLMGKQWAKVKEFEDNLKRNLEKTLRLLLRSEKSRISAKIMAEFIASQLEARMPYRKVAKNVLQKIMEKWAAGSKNPNWMKTLRYWYSKNRKIY